jgi:hypothetical protein
MTAKPRLTRKQLAARLRELGYPVSFSTFNKLCAPSRGGGPPVDGWWGRRPLYDEGTGIAWAEAYLRPARAVAVPSDPEAEEVCA